MFYLVTKTQLHSQIFSDLFLGCFDTLSALIKAAQDLLKNVDEIDTTLDNAELDGH